MHLYHKDRADRIDRLAIPISAAISVAMAVGFVLLLSLKASGGT